LEDFELDMDLDTIIENIVFITTSSNNNITKDKISLNKTSVNTS
jgi:hypothetical protein